MKIGILTHPLAANYGGVLQCYALNTYLRKLGYDTIVIDRKSNKSFFIKRIIRNILKALHHPRYYHPNQVDRTVNIRPFIEKNITTTSPINTSKEINKICNKYDLKAVIVGSDQVWRYSYAMKFGYNYFLDFVPDNVIKISYAASFGLNKWYYTAEQTEKIKNLLSKFKALSIREDEGIDLLKQNTGLQAVHLIDPTLLLDIEDYDKITSNRLINEKYIFVYWLGDKSDIINSINRYENKGYKIVSIYLRDNRPQESIGDWLSLIKNADLVITDSFHGCVFSIIFNVPFINYSNDSGGNGRIRSLFKQLGIENKLINPEAALDYTVVNTIIKSEQQKSNEYLTKNLFYDSCLCN